MTFEEWWEDPKSNAYLLHGGTQSKAQSRSTWHAAQEAMRERAAKVALDTGPGHDTDVLIVEHIRALEVE